MIYSREEFLLKVIEKISIGHFSVKINEDGSVLLDVCGFMQSNGEIGPHPDSNFSSDKYKEFLVK